MKPTRRPVLFTLAGSVVGTACAALIALDAYRPASDPAVTADADPTPAMQVVLPVSGNGWAKSDDAGSAARSPVVSDRSSPLFPDWTDVDALGHIAPSFATRAAQASWHASFGPTPSETVLKTPGLTEERDETPSVTSDAESTEPMGQTEPSLKPGDVVDITLTIGAGETLMGLLLDQEIPRATAVTIVEALTKTYNPRSLRAGQEMTLSFVVSENADLNFRSLAFEPSVGVVISLSGDDNGGFVSKKEELPLVRHVVRYDGTIQSSLSEAAIKAGTPQRVLADMIRVFSYDVDFQRDLREGDSFELFYEQMETTDGRTARTGDLLYAAVTLSGKEYKLYRFEVADGIVDYYNENGEGVRKALLRTPINGARLSSNFGMRRHPVLGYSRMHKGTDFAAPTGTPIYAAGDGVVSFANFNKSYGNHVRIRHDSEFQTVYAHMRNIAKGVTPGSRVKQGQVIGYVGSTGMSTGPHLHYEIVRNGNHVNPATTRFAASKNLKGTDLARFQKERDRIYTAFAATPSGTKLASAK